MKPYVIYVLVDPRFGTVRYVGITTKENRLKGHIREAKSKSLTHKSTWIRSLLELGLLPIFTIIERTDDKTRECYWINSYRQSGCDLTNGTTGGDGLINPSHDIIERIRSSVTGFKHSPEARAKISESMKRRNRERPEILANPKNRLKAVATLKKNLEEHPERRQRYVSYGMKGKTMTLEHRQKISESNKRTKALKRKEVKS